MSKNTLSSNRPQSSKYVNLLYSKISTHIEYARASVRKTVDTEMVKAYWLIGRDIVEVEQNGQLRAGYGKFVLKQLSKKLTHQYGKGFGIRVLERSRKFFLIYQDSDINTKTSTTSTQFKQKHLNNNLSWSHYVELIKIKRSEARQFYEIEAAHNHWTVRELRRQIDSFLYDRLAKTKDQNKVAKLALKGQEINQPQDAIKEPLILEFLGIPEAHSLSESKLESALINNLQTFLLELGKGFAFMARQKRITFDNSHYYADLVLYHAILKCYVIIDLKTHQLTHADFGQMQLYVNYFDQEIKQNSDNPTIGLVLCTEQRNEMAKYMLGKQNKFIFTSTY